MNSLELNKILTYLKKNIPIIYSKALSFNNNEFVKKELNDISTFTDKYMEKEIFKLIRKKFPDHQIIGEEYGSNGSNCYEWLIDPIDGTVNFAAGIPMFGTSIALRKNGETIFGIIFDWPENKIYYAIKGQGAYCNSERLHVSFRTKLDECIISICLTGNYNENETRKVLNIIEKIQKKIRGIRIVVCTVYELMWIATGKTDAMINIKPSIGLSSCAGKLIIKEAGGRVTNLRNTERDNVDDLLITNSLIHDFLYNELK